MNGQRMREFGCLFLTSLLWFFSRWNKRLRDYLKPFSDYNHVPKLDTWRWSGVWWMISQVQVRNDTETITRNWIIKSPIASNIWTISRTFRGRVAGAGAVFLFIPHNLLRVHRTVPQYNLYCTVHRYCAGPGNGTPPHHDGSPDTEYFQLPIDSDPG